MGFPELQNKPPISELSKKEHDELRQQGLEHFNESVSILEDSQVDWVREVTIEVAELMSSVGIKPEGIHSMLQRQIDAMQEHDPLYQRYSFLTNLLEVNALMGDYDAVKKNSAELIEDHPFPLVSSLCYAADVQIGRGEDPTELLTLATQIVEGYDTNDPSSSKSHQIGNYAQIGSLYIKAKKIEEGRLLLAKAEDMTDEAREKYNSTYTSSIAHPFNMDELDSTMAASRASEGVKPSQCYDDLATHYSEVGLFYDALRVVSKLKEDKSDYYISVMNTIIEQQINQGHFYDAVETAEQVGGLLHVIILVKQIVYYAQKGESVTNIITTINKAITVPPDLLKNDIFNWRLQQIIKAARNYDEISLYLHQMFLTNELSIEQEIVVRLALAHAAFLDPDYDGPALCDKLLQSVYDSIYSSEEMEEDVFRAELLLTFATGIDDIGYDALPLFEDVFKSLDTEMKDTNNPQVSEPEWHLWGTTCMELIDRGYLELAREKLQEFPHHDDFRSERAHLLAYLGAAEIKKAGISTPSPAL